VIFVEINVGPILPCTTPLIIEESRKKNRENCQECEKTVMITKHTLNHSKMPKKCLIENIDTNFYQLVQFSLFLTIYERFDTFKKI